MRNTVINEIERLAETDERICIITADLGYGVLESFRDRYPERYFNVGISEQLMTSAAAGMACCGKTVFTYSIGNFPTLRCIEQIRNDVCYPNANVKIIAVGGGFAYGQLGMSHHATEDIAMMRALPNMRVFTPADPEEALAAVRYAVAQEGPCYIRLARSGEPVLYEKAAAFDVTKFQCVRQGTDAAILVCGPVLTEGMKAVKILEEDDISCGLYSVPCVKPLDGAAVRRIAETHSWLVTVEEHNVIGGLGGAVAEELSGMRGTHGALIRLGLQDVFSGVVGSNAYLRDYYGISGEKIAAETKKALR